MRPSEEVKKQIVMKELNTLFVLFDEGSSQLVESLAEKLKFQINDHLRLCLVDVNRDGATSRELQQIYDL